MQSSSKFLALIRYQNIIAHLHLWVIVRTIYILHSRLLFFRPSYVRRFLSFRMTHLQQL
jgi:hypothetical protein